MSAGEYIWQGLKPCFKMLLTIGCGFALTKKGLFPPAASKGLSQVAMSIGLPCLLFSSMVPSFNSSNISNFGPLCLVAFLYQSIGLVLILIIRDVFYVPGDFQWGMIILGSLSNWGNLPTAIVQSVATERPFDSSTDPQLGIAYIAVFILVMNITFYGTGLYRICGWDFKEEHEEIPRTFRGRMARRRNQFRKLSRWAAGQWRHTFRRGARLGGGSSDSSDPEAATTGIQEKAARKVQKYAPPPFPRIERMPSTHADIESLAFDQPDIGEPVIDVVPPRSGAKEREAVISEKKEDQAEPSIPQESRDLSQGQGGTRLPSIQDDGADSRHRHTVLRSIKNSIMGLVTPATMGVIISLPFALVDPLKALIVEVPGWTGTRIHNAPDGKPPLAFFYDFTAFVGAMTIPGGLIVLGASFARLKLSRSRFREMPLGAIFASTIMKMAVMPLIGIFTVIGLRDNTTLFPSGQKMLSFVAFLLSGTPSAVNQLVVTQIFIKDGQTTDTLASFLIVQYSLLLVQSAALTAISLWLVS